MDFTESLGNLNNDFPDIDLGPDISELDPTVKIEIGEDAKERTPIEQLDCEESEWSGGFELYTCFDQLAGELAFKAIVPNNSWLSIGFGTTMTDTDMIAWFVDEGQGTVQDLFSTKYAAPLEDEIQDLVQEKAPVFDDNEGFMTFYTRRLLDTGDPQDYIVKVNE